MKFVSNLRIKLSSNSSFQNHRFLFVSTIIHISLRINVPYRHEATMPSKDSDTNSLVRDPPPTPHRANNRTSLRPKNRPVSFRGEPYPAG